MVLSSYIPSILEKNLPEVLPALFSRWQLDLKTVDYWAIHPGGRAILDKFVQSMDLSKEDLKESYTILREFGNMSSATIVFVLNEILKQGQAGTIYASAYGPGLTIESGWFEKV